MIKIRRNVFETNSSSVHSLTIGESADNFIDESADFTVCLGTGEYGWGYEELINWEDKANYFGVEAYHNECKKEMLEEAIKIKFPNINIEFYDTGYVDHQSSGYIWDEIDTVEDLYNVIFGNSFIVIDNDNH